jgi:dihydrofolate reductase
MLLSLHTFLTLDGVMQSPGGADEDTTGGFSHGGWLVPLADEDFGAVVTGWFERTEAILLGHKTYNDMYGYWSSRAPPAPASSIRRCSPARSSPAGSR